MGRIVIDDKFLKKFLLYNCIILKENGKVVTRLKNNNYVNIGKNVTIHDKVIISFSGVGNKVVIKDNCIFWNKTELRAEEKSSIVIGDRTSIGSAVVHASEHSAIRIGTDCLLADEIDIRSADGHKIYDKNNKRINKSSKIEIGNHVWIGKRVQCLKGTRIGDNNVVGANSLLTKEFKEENVIIAGHPASINKRDIKWEV